MHFHLRYFQLTVGLLGPNPTPSRGACVVDWLGEGHKRIAYILGGVGGVDRTVLYPDYRGGYMNLKFINYTSLKKLILQYGNLKIIKCKEKKWSQILI